MAFAPGGRRQWRRAAGRSAGRSQNSHSGARRWFVSSLSSRREPSGCRRRTKLDKQPAVWLVRLICAMLQQCAARSNLSEKVRHGPACIYHTAQRAPPPRCRRHAAQPALPPPIALVYSLLTTVDAVYATSKSTKCIRHALCIGTCYSMRCLPSKRGLQRAARCCCPQLGNELPGLLILQRGPAAQTCSASYRAATSPPLAFCCRMWASVLA